MNKILTEQYQRKIDGVLCTERKIIEKLKELKLCEGLESDYYADAKEIAKICSIRELVNIYSTQCMNVDKINLYDGLEDSENGFGSFFNECYNILGLHIINQSNEFIKCFDDKDYDGKKYKMTQQIIFDLQCLMTNLYKKYKSFGFRSLSCSYEKNVYYTGYIVQDTCMNIAESFKLPLKTITFIRDMSKIYNGEDVKILDETKDSNVGVKFTFKGTTVPEDTVDEGIAPKNMVPKVQ